MITYTFRYSEDTFIKYLKDIEDLACFVDEDLQYEYMFIKVIFPFDNEAISEEMKTFFMKKNYIISNIGGEKISDDLYEKTYQITWREIK